MIIAVDIETQGLDARKFIIGCLMQENRKKEEYFYTKEDLWHRILELGEAELKRKRCLNVYSHNAAYDFYGYADITDKNLVWFSHDPFIVKYRTKNGKGYINFLDTMSIYLMSLKKVGELINLPKLEMPQYLEEGRPLNYTEIENCKPYLKRDTEITLKCIEEIKKRTRYDGINIKRFYTISQIAINYFLNHLKKEPKYDYMFYNKEKGMIWRPKNKQMIHAAYRAGRVEAFKTGIFENATVVDCNSLWPYCSQKIRFPDIRTERIIKNPLQKMDARALFTKIGISRCMLINKTNAIGLLPIRTTVGSFYPGIAKYLIGTWTHEELLQAISEGYELILIEKSVIWEEAENPFKEITPLMYERRKSGDELDNYLYKFLMNTTYGKLGSYKRNKYYILDSVEKFDEYKQQNIQGVKGIGLNYLYKGEDVYIKHKPYYCPIIPVLITSKARQIMHDQYTKIPLLDLLYTDTDSVVYLGNHDNKFEIGTKMGDYKIDQGKSIIYGRKSWSIGQKFKISGLRKSGVSLDDFEKGFVESKKMITLNNSKDLSQIGGFKPESRNLKKQTEEYKKIKQDFNNLEVYWDCDIDNLEYFMDHINKVLSGS